ncbi:hypothetical protein EMN47_17455 [Prolixibacteraceae bacterium JC049]|nr:hypothetical protein [Prolixibacteraceae bacterium JC049]
METLSINNLNEFIDKLIGSYESRISSMQKVFDQSEHITESSFDLLRNFSNSLNNYRKQRREMSLQLRENLAQKGSLRRKDYDQIMQPVLNCLHEKEEATELYFTQFIEEQKRLMRSLKKGILEIKNNLPENSSIKINSFRTEISQVSQELELKKKQAIQHFNDFQQIHQKTIETLKELLKKEEHIAIKEVKLMHSKIINKVI